MSFAASRYAGQAQSPSRRLARAAPAPPARAGVVEARSGADSWRWTRWYLVLFFALVSGVLVFANDEPLTNVVGLGVLTIAGIIATGVDLAHPYTWFGVSFFAYSASTPILVAMHEASAVGSLHKALTLEWIALVAFLVAVGPAKRTPVFTANLDKIVSSAKFLYGLCFLASVVFVAAAWFGGYTDKLQLLRSNSFWLKLSSAFPVMSLAFAVLVTATILRRRRPPWGLLVFTLGWTSFALLVTGERDFVYRAILIAALLMHSLYRHIGRMGIAVLIIAAFGFVPLLASLKVVLISHEKVDVSFSRIVVGALSDEPATASRNLDVLLSQPDAEGKEGGRTLLQDIRRAALPSSFFPQGDDPTSVFNRTFYPNYVAGGGGVGFTLVGEGYLNFGALGVGMWFAFLGLVIRALYSRSAHSPIWLVAYVTMVPIAVYIIRADFSNLMAQSTKHVLIPIMLLYAGRSVLRNRNVVERDRNPSPPRGQVGCSCSQETDSFGGA